MPAHDDRARRDDGGGRGVAWTRRWWRALVSELVATALLVWLGVASAAPGPRGPPPLTHPALAFGFVVLANVLVFGAVSGAHMNPAISLAALLAGQLPAGAALAYVCAQLAGAVLGFGALLATVPLPAPVGCTAPAAGVAPAAAAVIEAALTGLLALACCAAWAEHDPARPDHTLPIKLGLIIAGLVYAGGEATGASLNPARSLGPALLHGHWDYHWVYWAGPLAGAALGALLHRHVLRPPRAARAPPPRAPEDVPLADKP